MTEKLINNHGKRYFKIEHSNGYYYVKILSKFNAWEFLSELDIDAYIPKRYKTEEEAENDAINFLKDNK